MQQFLGIRRRKYALNAERPQNDACPQITKYRPHPKPFGQRGSQCQRCKQHRNFIQRHIIHAKTLQDHESARKTETNVVRVADQPNP